KTEFLSDAHELSGQRQTPVLGRKPQKQLVVRRFVGLEAPDRLGEKDEAVPLQRLPDEIAPAQPAFANGAPVPTRTKDFHPPTAVGLGLVHCDVGAGHYFLSRGPVTGEKGETDARGNANRPAFQDKHMPPDALLNLR